MLSGTRSNVWLTGEMSHHEVLELAARGVTVILADHSNTERGYLALVKDKLSEQLDGVNVIVSSVDRDPLQIV